MRPVLAALGTQLLSRALRALAAADTSPPREDLPLADQPMDGAGQVKSSQIKSDQVKSSQIKSMDDGAPSDDEARQPRSLAAALMVLDTVSESDLADYLVADPMPALELLRAVLPAAVGLSSAIVGDVAQADAAAERLALCVSVVQLLIPAAAATVPPSPLASSPSAFPPSPQPPPSPSPLRAGLRELLATLAAASQASLLPPELRQRALAASIAVATLPTAPAVPPLPCSGTCSATAVADASSMGVAAGDVAAGGAAAGDTAAGDDGGRALLREAAGEMLSEIIPLRAAALATIRHLFVQRRPAVVEQLELVVNLCEGQLASTESFVYQAALNALESAAAAAPSYVLPRLASLMMPHGVGPEDSGTSSSAAMATTKASGHDATLTGSEIGVGGERRLKAAQAICQAVLRLGDMIPPHADAIMGALLVGVVDPLPAVRQSCLACLADVSATLRFALHPWAVEILQCVGSALEGETDEAARRAACYLLALLLQSLGTEALTVLPASQLTSLYRRLKLLRDQPTRDEALHAHVLAALEQLRMLGHALVRGASDAASTDSGRDGRGGENGGVLSSLAGAASKPARAASMPLISELELDTSSVRL